MSDMHRLNEAEWRGSDSDLSISEEDDDLAGDQPSSSKARGVPKRMAEDKLHEKRLKERARRNGMAKSIDQMRLIVPELMDTKKVYSQAKVVAIALQHIFDLQRENGDMRQRLGLKPRDQEPRPLKGKRAHSPSSPPPPPSVATPPGAGASSTSASGGSSSGGGAGSGAAPKRDSPLDLAEERQPKRRRVDDASSSSGPTSSSLTLTPPSAAALLTLSRVLSAQLPPPPASAHASSGAPVQVRLGHEDGGVLEALVLDHSPSASHEERDDDSFFVADTPLTLSPRHDHEPSELYPPFGFGAAASAWEEHEHEPHGSRALSQPVPEVDRILQDVLDGALAL